MSVDSRVGLKVLFSWSLCDIDIVIPLQFHNQNLFSPWLPEEIMRRGENPLSYS